MKDELKKQLGFTISQFYGLESHRIACRNIAYAISNATGFEKEILWEKFKKL